MKTLVVHLFCFLAISAHAAPIPVLGFKHHSIDIYNTDGTRDTKELGDSKGLVLKQILDNGLCILQRGNEEFIVDPFELELPPEAKPDREDPKALVGKPLDYTTKGVNGIGGD